MDRDMEKAPPQPGAAQGQASPPFSYRNRFVSVLRERRPDIWDASQGEACDAEDHILKFVDDNSCIPYVCVHGDDEQLSIYWGEVEHEHFPGWLHNDVDEFSSVFDMACDYFYDFISGETHLIIQNDNEREMVPTRVLERAPEIMIEISDEMATWGSGHRRLLNHIRKTEDFQHIVLSWTRPNDDAAKRDFARIEDWKSCRIRYCGGVMQGKVPWRLWLFLRLRSRHPIRGVR